MVNGKAWWSRNRLPPHYTLGDTLTSFLECLPQQACGDLEEIAQLLMADDGSSAPPLAAILQYRYFQEALYLSEEFLQVLDGRSAAR